MDDIDKLRDDLQSTKQMLAQELRNKEAQERENKRLLAKIQILEAELNKPKTDGEGKESSSSSGGNNDALVKTLKAEAEEGQKTTKLLEKKYHDVAGQLDTAKSEVEDQKRKIAELEKKLAQAEVKLSLLYHIPKYSNFVTLYSLIYSIICNIAIIFRTQLKRTPGAAIAVA